MITVYIGDNNNLGFEVPLEDVPMNVSDVETLLTQKIGQTPVRKCIACQCSQVGVIKCQKGKNTETLLVDRGLLGDPKAIHHGVALFMYDNGEEIYSVIFGVKPEEQIHPLVGTAVVSGSIGGAVASPIATSVVGFVGAAATAVPSLLLGVPFVPVAIVSAALGGGLAISGLGIANAIKTKRKIGAWKEVRRGKASEIANVVGIGTLDTKQQQIAIFGTPMLPEQRPEYGWGTFAIEKSEMPDYFFFVSGRMTKSAKNALAQFSRYSTDIVVHDIREGRAYKITKGKVNPRDVITTKYVLAHYEPDFEFGNTTENQDATRLAQQSVETPSDVL